MSNMIGKTLPALALCAASLNANAGDDDLITVSKASALIGTYHFERQTPKGNDYNELNLGGALYFKHRDIDKCSFFVASFTNSVHEHAIVGGAECDIFKTSKLGGLNVDLSLGLIFKGYNNYRESFEDKTGLSTPPALSFGIVSEALTWTFSNSHSVAPKLLVTPPSKHSASVGLGVNYTF